MHQRIDNTQANILIIGAGGIGCELIKHAVMNGFKQISIVDMDKVEKSNLNRQFLFDQSCIGKYKSEMAKESILKIRQDVNLKIESYVGNIKDKNLFPDNFFQSFNLILNALDNIEARTYINKICFIFNIPLINSGTEGSFGNVNCHIKGKTSCYSCAPKIRKKLIPVCSIKSKPEKFEHCVIYAKSIFERFFCLNFSNSYLQDLSLTENYLKDFQRIFFFEILDAEKANENVKPIDIEYYQEFEAFDINESDFKYEDYCNNIHKYDDISITDINIILMVLLNASKRLKNKQKFDCFNKEDNDSVNFIYAVSLIRALNFKINNVSSRFETKKIAGNIVPAIASVNAIIASIQIAESLKLVNKGFSDLRSVYISEKCKILSNLSTDDFVDSNCFICSIPCAKIYVNVDNFTMLELINATKKELNITSLQFIVGGQIIYEDDDNKSEDEDYMNDEESNIKAIQSKQKLIEESIIKILGKENLQSGITISDSNKDNFKVNICIIDDIELPRSEYRFNFEINNNISTKELEKLNVEDEEILEEVFDNKSSILNLIESPKRDEFKIEEIKEKPNKMNEENQNILFENLEEDIKSYDDITLLKQKRKGEELNYNIQNKKR